jgi:hypothetical protein
MVFLATVAFLEWKKRGDPVSAVLVTAFLGNHLQTWRTLSEIWCEPLLFLLVFVLWWRADRMSVIEKRDRASVEDGPGRPLLFHGISGLLSGFAYLTKGTGFQVAVFFWITVLVFSRARRWGLFGILVFLLTASPLLYWNTLTYGNPLYSFASTHNMWFDKADEIWYEDADDLPTMGSYLASHTWGEIAARVGRGLLLESKMTAQLFWPDWSLPAIPENSPVAWIHSVFKAIVFGLTAIGFVFMFATMETNETNPHTGTTPKLVWGCFWNRAGRGNPIASPSGIMFFILLAVVFFLTFGWYAQLTHAPRFLMTIVPIASLLGARLAARGINVVCGTDLHESSPGESLPPTCHCERSEAISGCDERQDCFVVPPRNDCEGEGVSDLQSDEPTFHSTPGFCATDALRNLLIFLVPALLLAWSIVSFAWSAHFALQTRVLPPPALSPLAERVIDRLDELPVGTRIAFGPSHGLPIWMTCGDLRWRATPWRVEWDRFAAMLEREKIDCVMVDDETAERRLYLRRLLKPGAAEELGWRLLFRDRGEGGSFILYGVTQNVPPQAGE